jgi:hypothetical protein
VTKTLSTPENYAKPIQAGEVANPVQERAGNGNSGLPHCWNGRKRVENGVADPSPATTV